jgi:gallate dioxygenase
MARIIGGIGSSHTPTIGFAVDQGKQDDPVWAPIFEAYRPVREWLEAKRPDVLFFIYNDHVTSFFFDHYSAFTLGVGESYAAADEGGGPRSLPPVRGHGALARHIGRSLMHDEFDMSFFQSKPLDHGCLSPLSVMWPYAGGWPGAVIPLAVGVLQFPIPSARRCYRFGQALRRAIESFPEDLSVAIVATGGLSHQVHGERAGFNNPEWDEKFLDMVVEAPEALAETTHAQYAELGGWEGAEVIMWLIMRGALPPRVNCLHRSYYLPSMTGIANLLLEPADAQPGCDADFDPAAHRTAMARQLDGAERLAGTYPFTLAESVRAFRLNKYLRDMVGPEHRALFLSDPEASFARAGLSEAERALIRNRDWAGMIHYGAIFFGLEKLAAVLGLPNAAVYAGMRGQSLEDFQKTRNAPGAVYSVSDIKL